MGTHFGKININISRNFWFKNETNTAEDSHNYSNYLAIVQMGIKYPVD